MQRAVVQVGARQAAASAKPGCHRLQFSAPPPITQLSSALVSLANAVAATQAQASGSDLPVSEA
jgi:hypothetical protein